MDKTIDTTPYVQRFQSSYNYDYYQKHNKNCIFILSSSYELSSDRHMLLFVPQYKMVHNEYKIWKYNEDMYGKRLHSISDLSKYIQYEKKDITQRVVDNKRYLDCLLSVPKGFEFEVYYKQVRYYKVKFTEQKAYVFNDGKIGRRISIIKVFAEKILKDKVLENNASSKEVQADSTYKAYSEISFDKKQKVKVYKTKRRDPFYYFDAEQALKSIQLIRGNHNHITRKHKIEDRTVSLVLYHRKEKQYSKIDIAVHFCKTCDTYFDFYDSFKCQLEQNRIQMQDLVLNCYDGSGKTIHMNTNALNEQSKLKMFGYQVGQNGLSDRRRHELLKRLINGNYLSASEIKQFLEFYINFNGKRKNMVYAKKCWKQDIDYVNQLIKNKYR